MATSARPSRFQRVFLAALITLGPLGFVLLATLMFGGVTGEEFSPDTFQRRRFTFYRIPILRKQITPVWRKSITNSLERYLAVTGLIKKPRSKPVRWEVVRMRLVDRKIWEGNVQVLCNYLDQKNSSNENAWLEWSRQNQEKAKIIWPEIANCARHGLYWMVPDIFDSALERDDQDDLTRHIQSILYRDSTRIGDAYRAAREFDEAIRLYSFAIVLNPTAAPARQGRASCYRSMKQRAKAEEDLQAIRDSESLDPMS